MAVAASLNVLLKAQTGQFTTAMKKAEATASSFGASVKRLATVRSVVGGAANAMRTMEKGVYRTAAGFQYLSGNFLKLSVVLLGPFAAAFRAVPGAMKAFDGLSVQLKSIAASLVGALTPAIESFTKAIEPAMLGVKNFIDKNKGAVVAIAATGAALLGLAIACKVLSAAFAILGVVVAAVKVVLLVVSAICSPITLGIIAIGAALAGLVYWFSRTQAGAAFFNRMGATLRKIADDARTAFGGIVAALQSGDLGLAAKIACTFVELAWVRMIDNLRKEWSRFIEWWRNNMPLQIAGGAIGQWLLHQATQGNQAFDAATQARIRNLEAQLNALVGQARANVPAGGFGPVAGPARLGPASLIRRGSQQDLLMDFRSSMGNTRDAAGNPVASVQQRQVMLLGNIDRGIRRLIDSNGNVAELNIV